MSNKRFAGRAVVVTGAGGGLGRAPLLLAQALRPSLARAAGVILNQSSMASLQLLRQNGLPEDIVRLALFLASDDARFITNEIVSCDSGNRMRGFRV